MTMPRAAQPLDPESADVPETTQDIVRKARTSWLKNNEVFELLQLAVEGHLSLSGSAPELPDDNKTIRETHEKLKVGNVERLNCYYAHADEENFLQRRCYWLLERELDYAVLVHYLCTTSTRTQKTGDLKRVSPGTYEEDDGWAEGRSRRPQRAARVRPTRYAELFADDSLGTDGSLPEPGSQVDTDYEPSSLGMSSQGGASSSTGPAVGGAAGSGGPPHYAHRTTPGPLPHAQRGSGGGSADVHAAWPANAGAGFGAAPGLTVDDRQASVLPRFPSDISFSLDALMSPGGSRLPPGEPLPSLDEQWRAAAAGGGGGATSVPPLFRVPSDAARRAHAEAGAALQQQFLHPQQQQGQGQGQGAAYRPPPAPRQQQEQQAAMGGGGDAGARRLSRAHDGRADEVEALAPGRYWPQPSANSFDEMLSRQYIQALEAGSESDELDATLDARARTGAGARGAGADALGSTTRPLPGVLYVSRGVAEQAESGLEGHAGVPERSLGSLAGLAAGIGLGAGSPSPQRQLLHQLSFSASDAELARAVFPHLALHGGGGGALQHGGLDDGAQVAGSSTLSSLELMLSPQRVPSMTDRRTSSGVGRLVELWAAQAGAGPALRGQLEVSLTSWPSTHDDDAGDGGGPGLLRSPSKTGGAGEPGTASPTSRMTSSAGIAFVGLNSRPGSMSGPTGGAGSHPGSGLLGTTGASGSSGGGVGAGVLSGNASGSLPPPPASLAGSGSFSASMQGLDAAQAAGSLSPPRLQDYLRQRAAAQRLEQRRFNSLHSSLDDVRGTDDGVLSDGRTESEPELGLAAPAAGTAAIGTATASGQLQPSPVAAGDEDGERVSGTLHPGPGSPVAAAATTVHDGRGTPPDGVQVQVFRGACTDPSNVLADRGRGDARPSYGSSPDASGAGVGPCGRRRPPTALPVPNPEASREAAAAAARDSRAAKLGPVRAARGLTDADAGAMGPPLLADDDHIAMIDSHNPLFRFTSFLGPPRRAPGSISGAAAMFQSRLDTAGGGAGAAPTSLAAWIAAQHGSGSSSGGDLGVPGFLLNRSLGGRSVDGDAGGSGRLASDAHGTAGAEAETRALLKNMSIDEVDAVAALAAVAPLNGGGDPRSWNGRPAAIAEESSGALLTQPSADSGTVCSTAGSDDAEPTLRFRIEDFTPDGCSVLGGDKMFIAGEVERATGQWARCVHLCFGDLEVPAVVMNSKVIKCVVPRAQAPGTISLFLTLGDGVPVSNQMAFEYRHVVM